MVPSLSLLLLFTAAEGANFVVNAAIGEVGDACIGKSASLAASQCQAWVDLHDSTGGPDWSDCARQRLDPCACDALVTCGSGGTVITGMSLTEEGMVGTLPVSLRALQNMTAFSLWGNKLTGLVPDGLPYLGCTLLNDRSYDPDTGKYHRMNQFDCPFPEWVLRSCMRDTASNRKVPVTQADCGPQKPSPAPTPRLKFACVNATCVVRPTGVFKKQCERACQ